MGIQDRDYYLDDLRKKQGYTERAEFRVPLGVPGARKSGLPVGVLLLALLVGLLALVGWVVLRIFGPR